MLLLKWKFLEIYNLFFFFLCLTLRIYNQHWKERLRSSTGNTLHLSNILLLINSKFCNFSSLKLVWMVVCDLFVTSVGNGNFRPTRERGAWTCFQGTDFGRKQIFLIPLFLLFILMSIQNYSCPFRLAFV